MLFASFQRRRYLSIFIISLTIATATSAQFNQGWVHERNGIIGNNFYTDGSSILTYQLSQNWIKEISEISNTKILTGDVNSDGKLEIVTIQDNKLIILSASGSTLLSVDIEISGIPDSWVTMLEDVNDDGYLDIGVTYHRGNNNYGDLKARIYDYQGNILKEFTKSSNADGDLSPITMIGSEILIGQQSGYAKDPRGFSRWNYSTNAELWYYDIGPANRGYSIADIDNDGLLDILISNSSVHNGASGNGTTDGDNYFIIIDENGNTKLTKKYSEGDANGGIKNYFINRSTGSEYNILSFKDHGNAYQGTSKMHICDQSATALFSFYGYSNSGWSHAWADIDGDNKIEIVVSNYNDSKCRIYIFDEELNVEYSQEMSSRYYINAIVDVDGDGKLELITSSRDEQVVKVFNNRLEVECSLSVGTDETIYNVIVSDNDDNGKIDLCVLTDKNIVVFEGNANTAVLPFQDSANPESLLLQQNYPNPFNPTTKINFELEETEHVNITVFDIQGNQIETLLNRNVVPGIHQVMFNGIGLPSGIYIYRVQTGKHTQSKQMLLLK
ncbi:T9SS type A sorting domain-containing protein [bacterium]|nr:T9SS type A sorting domain-containing protein [bacterium]